MSKAKTDYDMKVTELLQSLESDRQAGDYLSGASITYADRLDEDATVGFDASIASYFLRAFIDEDIGRHEFRLGTYHKEFPTIDSLMIAASQVGLNMKKIFTFPRT